jgi:hypothetical protein
MKSIQEQIEALTQELRPWVGEKDNVHYFYFDEISLTVMNHWDTLLWYAVPFASYDKAEVEEYADCYRRLKLYQLLGKKAEKEFPLFWSDVTHYKAFKVGTDFTKEPYHKTGQVSIGARYRPCVFGGVWFSREEDRLEALKICEIDRAFQEKCAKYGLGGA